MLNPDMAMPEAEYDGYLYIGLLEIDSISLCLPIISQWDYSALKTAPVRYTGSAYQDNMVIAGHNYDSFFGHLKELQRGDTVRFTDVDGNIFQYQVEELDILEPAEVEAMVSSNWDLTLFTCTPGAASRIAVRCSRV